MQQIKSTCFLIGGLFHASAIMREEFHDKEKDNIPRVTTPFLERLPYHYFYVAHDIWYGPTL